MSETYTIVRAGGATATTPHSHSEKRVGLPPQNIGEMYPPVRTAKKPVTTHNSLPRKLKRWPTLSINAITLLVCAVQVIAIPLGSPRRRLVLSTRVNDHD